MTRNFDHAKRNGVPILFVIGPQRTGTSWLYSHFARIIENVYLDRLEKENYIFSWESSLPIEQRRRRFADRMRGKGTPELFVDVCSTYFGHKDDINRILDAYPNALITYIYRDEVGRERSVKAHQNLNAHGAAFIGYGVSDKLRATQAEFDAFESWLKQRVRPSHLCRLEFEDLKETGGQTWLDRLSSLTGVDLGTADPVVVNASKHASGTLQKTIYFGVRFLQWTRLHIVFKKWLRVRNYNQASPRVDPTS